MESRFNGLFDNQKKIFLSCIFCCFSFYLLSQGGHLKYLNEECGTKESTLDEINQKVDLKSYPHKLNEYKSLLTNKQSTDQVPIQLHIVRETNGTGGENLTDILNGLDLANSYLINANLNFVFCPEIDYIDNSALLNFDCGTDEDALLINYNPVAVNVYYVISACFGGRVSSYKGLHIIMATTSGNTLAHELGHYFGLRHTHGKFNSAPPDYETLNPTTNSFPTPVYYEGAVRYYNESLDDNLNSIFDCYETGDDICDTPAEPVMTGLVNPTTCAYTGTETDYFGDGFIPEVGNIMSYGNCRDHFTTEQYAKIRMIYELTENLADGPCPDEYDDQDLNPDSNLGPGHTTDVDLTDLGPVSTSEVEICVIIYGDISHSSESFNVYDESDNYIGTTSNGNSDCTFNPELCFTVLSDQFNSWVSDEILTVQLDPTSTSVNPDLCSRNSAFVFINIQGSIPCTNTSVVLEGEIPDNAEYIASDFIQASGSLNNPNTAILQAANFIALMEGFEVQQGASLTVMVDECDN